MTEDNAQAPRGLAKARIETLVDGDLPRARVRLGAERILVGIGIIAAGMGAAFVDTRVSLALFALVPLYFMFPGAIDRFGAPS